MTSHKIENIKINDKNGQLIINTLESAICISLANHINGKKFFNRNVYVKSVVQKSPVKNSEQDVEGCPNSLAVSSDTESSSDESTTEDASTGSKPPCSKLFTSISGLGKRSAGASPEVTSETKKKDKKKQKDSSSTAVRSSSRQGKTAPKK